MENAVFVVVVVAVDVGQFIVTVVGYVVADVGSSVIVVAVAAAQFAAAVVVVVVVLLWVWWMPVGGL